MSQRISKVNELLKREIITCVERNFEFPDVLVTIHAVDTAPNLRTAKVYVGVIGDANEAKNVVQKLNKKRGIIQNEMMKRVVLRNTPQLTFVGDNSVERGVHVLSILDEIGDIDLEEEEKV
ncbi:MAG: 30S ribosome-binding factor RbfA [Verrucomicrobiales bacterium]|nr:30S ribosome-binding factor RbfA [Verrucomicrobiales bacterium]